MDNILKHQVINPLVNYLGRRKERRHFDQPPIFIGGCGRTGTTLLLSILSAHLDIYAIPFETVAFVNWARSAPGIPMGGSELVPARIDRFYRYLILRRVPREARCWCEKTPRHVRHVENILEYWPQARFIHIVRDARDVLTSHHPSDPGNYWVTPERWLIDTTAGLEHEDHPRVYTLRYEDLIRDFEGNIASLCAFLELELSTEIRNWYEHATVRVNAAWTGKVSRLHEDSLRKWKRPEHAERYTAIMDDPGIMALMQRLGYL